MILRKDLISKRIRIGWGHSWVIKDPISERFFYLSDRQWALLQLLDGKRSLEQILQDFHQRYPGRYVSSDSVVRYLADVRRSRLIGGVMPQGSESKKETGAEPVMTPAIADRRLGFRSATAMHPLAIRFPGIDPSPIIDRLYPLVRPWLSIPGVILAMGLLLLAGTLLIIRFETLVNRLPDVQAWTKTSAVFLVIGCIALTKIIHELAHALVCRRFGGRCQQMGILLLVGIPCLYCDVSDAWLMPRRSARILVSAAGIIAEFTLAAIAVIVFFASSSGPLQLVCLSVMTVCSLGTIVVNGNPLMRYDGYFIATDLFGVPNLATQANRSLNNLCSRLFLGTPTSVPVTESYWGAIALNVYALACILYRVLVLGIICWSILFVAMTLHLRILGWLLVGWILLRSTSGMGRRLTARWRNPAFRRSIVPSRVFAAGGIVLIVIVLVCCVPLQRTISVPMVIRLTDAKQVYVTTPGIIKWGVHEGVLVNQGDLIATLSNYQLDRKVASSSTQIQLWKTRLSVVENRRDDDHKRAAQRPVIERQINNAKKQLRLYRRQQTELAIRAPISGMLFDPATHWADPDQPWQRGWQGTPLNDSNTGAFLKSGTLLGTIGNPSERVAHLFVSQNQVQTIEVGQRVHVNLAGYDGDYVWGHVSQINPKIVTRVPEAIALKGLIAIDPRSTQKRVPLNPTYRVVVQLDQTSVPIPFGVSGMGRIHVRPMTLALRIERCLKESLGSLRIGG